MVSPAGIAPALAFAAVGNSIRAAGFIPKFVDIKRDTLNIDSEKIEEKITNKTKAIMAVHTMGKPCEINKIMDLAKKYKLKVIEDCCEAHGGKYKDKFLGTWGDVAAKGASTAPIGASGRGCLLGTSAVPSSENMGCRESITGAGFVRDLVFS